MSQLFLSPPLRPCIYKSRLEKKGGFFLFTRWLQRDVWIQCAKQELKYYLTDDTKELRGCVSLVGATYVLGKTRNHYCVAIRPSQNAMAVALGSARDTKEHIYGFEFTKKAERRALSLTSTDVPATSSYSS